MRPLVAMLAVPLALLAGCVSSFEAEMQPVLTADTDGDGIPDIRDLDDDNDGIPDVEDSAPLDASKGAPPAPSGEAGHPEQSGALLRFPRVLA